MKFAGVAYLTKEIILLIHDEQLQEHGGQSGIRDHSGLEAAIEHPKAGFSEQEFYPTVFDKAAVYAFHISESQAFVDGNKRTALVAALTFLAINGYEILEERAELYDAMIKIATKEISKEELSDLFRNLVIETNNKI